jgi:hypothetical protein
MEAHTIVSAIEFCLRTNWSSLVYFRISEMKDHIKWIHHCRRWNREVREFEMKNSARKVGVFYVTDCDWLDWCIGLCAAPASPHVQTGACRTEVYRILRKLRDCVVLYVGYRYVQYCTVLYTTEWERERQRIWWCLLATKINNNNITTTLPPPTEPSHDKHNTSPSVSLSLLLSLSLLSLSLCHSHSLA